MNNANKAHYCPIIIGIILVLVGLIIQIPGGALTTHELLDGDSTTSYVFDNKYSAIDEYVGGDAYNYIIGASLVASKITGAIVAKSIFIVGGVMCFCFGLTLALLRKSENVNEPISIDVTQTLDSSNISVDYESNESPLEENL